MISPTESIETINKRLRDRMGLSSEGLPKFRVVSANEQTEKRFAVWNDFYGKIFLRQWTGVKEVPKYPQFKDMWILEQLVPNPHPEVYGTFQTYEPLWPFKDKNENPLAPEWNVIEFILHALLNGVEKEDWADWFDQENQRMRDEVAHFENVMKEEGRSDLFAFEDAVFHDSTKQKGWQRDGSGTGTVSSPAKSE